MAVTNIVSCVTLMIVPNIQSALADTFEAFFYDVKDAKNQLEDTKNELAAAKIKIDELESEVKHLNEKIEIQMNKTGNTFSKL